MKARPTSPGLFITFWNSWFPLLPRVSPVGSRMIIDAHWYDLERCRRVELKVFYTLNDGSLEVDSIWPASITFYERDSTKIDREIQIKTTRGREILVAQLFDSGEAYNLTLSLARKHGLLAAQD